MKELRLIVHLDDNADELQIAENIGEAYQKEYIDVLDIEIMDNNIIASWITPPIHTIDRVCSACGGLEPYKNADRETEIYHFCPHCGAKMTNIP